MYNDTIKAENKIITSQNLSQIFQLMGETLKKYQRISALEEQQNRMLERDKQHYTFKDDGSKFKAIVDFYDNTTITFDKYDSFASIFYSRLNEIKSINVNYNLNYVIINQTLISNRNWYNQSINMYITENRIDIEVKLSSEDPKLNEVYNLIKNIILSAPSKYDFVIKKKDKIINTIALAKGLIPSMIITTLLLFMPILNKIFFKGYIVYPLVCLLISYVIGYAIASSKLDGYYNTIIPEKKVTYENGERREKDDL